MFLKNIFVSCLQYRGLIKAITLREIYSRYAASLLGPLWIVFPPLFSVLVYTFVFARLLNPKISGIDSPYAYTIYICAGTVVWTAFLEVITKSKDIFITNAQLIKKASFPRIVLFVPIVLIAFLNGERVACDGAGFFLQNHCFFALYSICFVDYVFGVGFGGGFVHHQRFFARCRAAHRHFLPNFVLGNADCLSVIGYSRKVAFVAFFKSRFANY